MNSLTSALFMIVLGALGAALSVAFLFMGETNVLPSGGGDLVGQELPTVVFGAGFGFVSGVFVAVVWLLARRYLSPNARQV